jgi:aspartate kinase
MDRTLVMKFGGTSVGSEDAINRAATLILHGAEEWDNLTVVVSAMSGVTDLLIRCAKTAAQGDTKKYQTIIEELRCRHVDMLDLLFADGELKRGLQLFIEQQLANLAALSSSINILGEVTPRAMDVISSMGERINARIIASLLQERGHEAQAVDATECIVTDARFQSAVPLMDKTREKVRSRLMPLFGKKIIPVVTGFIAATEDGITTTLGRGGSDYTAAILGSCLDADEVWTWTDVDGVMTADPRLVPEAKVIPVLSYAEVSELAYFGAKVLHPKTIRPIVERTIPLWVKNTFNPSIQGTCIVRDADTQQQPVKAVTLIRDLSMVTVEGRGMMGVPGIAARTFGAVARQRASVLMISQASSEQSISFIIPAATCPEVIQSVESEMELELERRDIDRVWAMNDIVIVTVVGAGMRHIPGIAARVFQALANDGINVVAIAQGSSDFSLSLVVSSSDGAAAVSSIHSGLFD